MKPSRATKSSTFKSESAAAAFEASYVDYQYIFVQFLIEHLCDVAAGFRGDYQAMLVLAVIGQSRLHAVRSTRDAADGAAEAGIDARCNATSISEITGIPRQTVRRKLTDLTERGWITRNADSTYELAVSDWTSVARSGLSDIDRRALQRVARLYTDLGAIVETHDRVLEKSR